MGIPELSVRGHFCKTTRCYYIKLRHKTIKKTVLTLRRVPEKEADLGLLVHVIFMSNRHVIQEQTFFLFPTKVFFPGFSSFFYFSSPRSGNLPPCNPWKVIWMPTAPVEQPQNPGGSVCMVGQQHQQQWQHGRYYYTFANLGLAFNFIDPRHTTFSNHMGNDAEIVTIFFLCLLLLRKVMKWVHQRFFFLLKTETLNRAWNSTLCFQNCSQRHHKQKKYSLLKGKLVDFDLYFLLYLKKECSTLFLTILLFFC